MEPFVGIVPLFLPLTLEVDQDGRLRKSTLIFNLHSGEFKLLSRKDFSNWWRCWIVLCIHVINKKMQQKEMCCTAGVGLKNRPNFTQQHSYCFDACTVVVIMWKKNAVFYLAWKNLYLTNVFLFQVRKTCQISSFISHTKSCQQCIWKPAFYAFNPGNTQMLFQFKLQQMLASPSMCGSHISWQERAAQNINFQVQHHCKRLLFKGGTLL